MSKIPCTVAVLTLNSGSVLRRCLESVKDFEEIVICDGNSTDDTLAIAREYGCKIIKQYDSDESNLRCERDKANVRNKALDASSYDWHFYLDSDDALSPEAVNEIREITIANRPSPRIYKMPLRVIIGETNVITHSSNYPYIQMRLFNKRAGFRFSGDVHEKIRVDEKNEPVGTMRGYYDVHWSRDRIRHIFSGMHSYAEWEAEVYKKKPPEGYLKEVWFRIRAFSRVTLVSLYNYIRHGFAHTMPPRVELARLYYHVYLLSLMTKKQFKQDNV